MCATGTDCQLTWGEYYTSNNNNTNSCTAAAAVVVVLLYWESMGARIGCAGGADKLLALFTLGRGCLDNSRERPYGNRQVRPQCGSVVRVVQRLNER